VENQIKLIHFNNVRTALCALPTLLHSSASQVVSHIKEIMQIKRRIEENSDKSKNSITQDTKGIWKLQM
jgi:hypothetical protein